MRGMMLFAWGLLALATVAFVFALYTRHAATKEPPLPVMGTVDMPFRFTNQWGETISRDAFNGKVWVAYFFFTRCPSVCPTDRGLYRRPRKRHSGAAQKVGGQARSAAR
jgi:cytochrome oxidase Cu insertion factor (SCO1/SenC/PrrC family)